MRSEYILFSEVDSSQEEWRNTGFVGRNTSLKPWFPTRSKEGESRFRSIGVENGALIDDGSDRGFIKHDQNWWVSPPPIQKGLGT